MATRLWLSAIGLSILVGAGAIALASGSHRTGSLELSGPGVTLPGGPSAGGGYALHSVIGEPVVELSNASTGGGFTLQSGVLAGFAPLPPPQGDQRDSLVIY
jgi:hypothetical protein